MHLCNIPSADAIFYRFEKLNWADILYSMQTINDELYSKWNNKPTENAYLAVDAHDVPRYVRKLRNWKERVKRCDDIEKMVGTKATCGTHYCHQILSIDIVEEQAFTLGFEPIFSDSDIGERTVSLIENAKLKISIEAVLMDRGFFNGFYIIKLIEHKIPYIIRAMRNLYVKRVLEHVKQNKLPYYEQIYIMNNNSHKKNRKPVKTTLVIVDNAVLEENDPDLYDDDERYFAFITNLKVGSIDNAFKFARNFRKRWRIETGYRVKKTFLAKTCSLSYSMRLFLILLSFVLSNVWTLINSIYKDKIDFIRIYKNHLSSHMMKFIFGMVFIAIWQSDRG
jgi:hypothetical protein